ncbi:MAG: glycosyltransferase family 87 protein [Anaerolineae bacterium]|nr:glycosyltransferase family 87 protein [Anaerolineae bacterium]MDK1080292.1 glycosyltransferase family 87 protein [Anaerolineae bacterium]
MKKFYYFLIGAGILVLGVFATIDLFGSDSYKGIGAAQLLGMQTGVFLILVGVGFLIANLHETNFKIQVKQKIAKIINLPTIVWSGIGLLLMSYFFFYKPMFLNSQLQIDYFNRYLPHTSLIGLDIRTIITAIENWLVTGRSPYINGLLAYPPIVLIFFSPLILIGFPAYFNLITYVTLIGYIFASLVFPITQNKRNQNSIIYILFALGLISYGLQFELERGQFNLIAFAICCASIYIFHAYPKLRFFSYILFSLSIQLKIYTAIFILLFVDNWSNWKATLRRFVGIGLLNLSLLFILGITIFRDFLDSLFINQFNLTTWNGVSIRSFVFRLSRTGYDIFSEDIIIYAQNNPNFLELLLLLLYGLCLGVQIFFVASKKLNGFSPHIFVTCAIGALIIPTISNDYKLPILIGPMAILLSSLLLQDRGYKKIFSIILIIIISAAIGSTFYPFEVKPEIIHNNLPVLFIILISTTILLILSGVNGLVVKEKGSG